MNRIYDEISAKRNMLLKAVISDKRNDSVEYSKMTLRPVDLRGEVKYQVERFKNNQVFHLNLAFGELESYFDNEIVSNYKQVNLFFSDGSASYFIGDNGKMKRREKKSEIMLPVSMAHNREKEFILKEGENIPALVDLGVFTSDFKIVRGKYDKYKQINRFIELIDDAFKKSKRDKITILDFGCGKSYLTFIVYYYFVKIRGISANIIGYDLKEDVVNGCNDIAKRYGYDGLRFVKSDVSRDTLYNEEIDMIISLHACDTATDYALNYAITKRAKYIFSVPCCQHEVNISIKKGGDFDIMLDYGIIKERFSALLTDVVRAKILEDMGYSTDVIEFVDLAHSPKNIMLRAEKTRHAERNNYEELLRIKERYGFDQKLFELVYGNK